MLLNLEYIKYKIIFILSLMFNVHLIYKLSIYDYCYYYIISYNKIGKCIYFTITYQYIL